MLRSPMACSLCAGRDPRCVECGDPPELHRETAPPTVTHAVDSAHAAFWRARPWLALGVTIIGSLVGCAGAGLAARVGYELFLWGWGLLP